MDEECRNGDDDDAGFSWNLTKAVFVFSLLYPLLQPLFFLLPLLLPLQPPQSATVVSGGYQMHSSSHQSHTLHLQALWWVSVVSELFPLLFPLFFFLFLLFLFLIFLLFFFLFLSLLFLLFFLFLLLLLLFLLFTGRYMNMMMSLECISYDVIKSMTQLIDYYFYAVSPSQHFTSTSHFNISPQHLTFFNISFTSYLLQPLTNLLSSSTSH